MCTSPLRKRGSLLQLQTGCVVKKTEDWWHPIKRMWPQLSVHGRLLGWGCPNDNGKIGIANCHFATAFATAIQLQLYGNGKETQTFFFLSFHIPAEIEFDGDQSRSVCRTSGTCTTKSGFTAMGVDCQCFKCRTVLFAHVSRRTFPNKLEGVFVMFIGWGYLKIRSEENICTQRGERGSSRRMEEIT